MLLGVGAAGGTDAAAAEAPKEEAKEEEKIESDDDMVRPLSFVFIVQCSRPSSVRVSVSSTNSFPTPLYQSLPFHTPKILKMLALCRYGNILISGCSDIQLHLSA